MNGAQDDARVKPELDYAFLASWAGIQADGTLTCVGMSFLRVLQAPVTSMAVAGRIRLFDQSPPTQLGIRVAIPGGGGIEVTDQIQPSGEDSRRYGENREQVLFVLNTQVPTIAIGKYDVILTLGNETVRRLSFEVAPLPPAPSNAD